MNRRALVISIVAMSIVPARASRAQSAPPVIGFLNGGSPGPFAHLVTGFKEGLAATGFIEGNNVSMKFRWADGRYDRLPALAAELLRERIDLLVACGGENAAMAAKAATSTVPIVFAVGGHPVEAGLVASLGRPGGNLTGLTQYTGPLESKRLGLLLELVPSATSVAVLVNPSYAPAAAQLRDVEDGAKRTRVRLIKVSAKAESDLEAAFDSMAKQGADALVVGADPFFNTRRDRIVALAARQELPAIYEFREFVAAGGLMSYGANLADGYRQIGGYAGRVLKGAKPADLPVLQPTHFEMVVNNRTARALNLTIPNALMIRAEEVIR